MKILASFFFFILGVSMLNAQSSKDVMGLSIMQLSEDDKSFYLSWKNSTSTKSEAYVELLSSDGTYSRLPDIGYSGSGYSFYELGELGEGLYTYRVSDAKGKHVSNSLTLKVETTDRFLSFVETEIRDESYLEVKNELNTKEVVFVLFDEDGIMVDVLFQGKLNQGLNLMGMPEMVHGNYNLKVVSTEKELLTSFIVLN